MNVRIGTREVGPDHPCLVVAEAGVNHNGELELARRLVGVAADAGADAVKFQTFRAEHLVTDAAPKAHYQAESGSEEESQRQMLERLELSKEAHRELQTYCRERDILFLSSPFDAESAEFLAGLRVPAIKVPSGEITNLPLLRRIGGLKLPVVLSTGMSDLGEVEEAVVVLQGMGCEEIVLLHCVSCYPTDPGDVSLRTMATLRHAFGLPVGFSDHTLGLEVPLAAVALGACVLEKHFTLDRGLPGPDHEASLEPEELADLVRGIRTVEQALGDGRKRPAECEEETAEVARKSLVAARNIAAGERIASDAIVASRPGTGIPPSLTEVVVGRTAGTEIQEGSLITWEMIS